MSNAPTATDAGDRTVRDLVQREYRRHQLRRGILDHEELATPIEIASQNRDVFLTELSMLPGVGPKAVRVISDLLENADPSARGTKETADTCGSAKRLERAHMKQTEPRNDQKDAP